MEKKARFNCFLYYSVISMDIAAFTLGACFGWSSPSLLKLNGKIDPQENPLGKPINKHEEAWIASLLPLGTATSCFLFGYLADKLGRKCTLLIAMVPMILGLTFITFANRVWYFYMGRFLNGISCGAIYTIIPIYVGEIAENTNRGTVSCIFAASTYLGNIFSFSVGPYVSIKVLGFCLLAKSSLFMILFGFFVPESPYYWITKEKQEHAEKCLMKFRRKDVDLVQKELPEIIRNVAESLEQKGHFGDLFLKKHLLKALGITLALNIFQQISGTNFLMFYMQSIFQESDSIISSDLSVIIVAIFRFASAACASMLVDRLGRRILLIASSLGTGFALICFGVYSLFKDMGADISCVHWVPMVSIIFFFICYCFGLSPIPYTLLSELFPSHVKSLASSLSVCICLGSMFCVTNFYPLVIQELGMAYGLFILSFFCCMGGLFTYLLLPETKGKSFEEIQALLKKKTIVL